MAIQASTITTRVRTQLIDNGTPPRWTDTELLQWLTDGERTIVASAPGAASTTVIMPLVAGTLQYIPTDGHMLLGIVRNTNADGGVPGRAVRIIAREVLDGQRPNWHTEARNKIVRNYVFDSAEAKKFYVYPPNDGSGYVEIVYAKLPPELVNLTDTLTVQEVYQTALFDYVMFRAHQKDSDFAAGQQVAAIYLQAFMTFMGSGEMAQGKESPNQELRPVDPDVRGS